MNNKTLQLNTSPQLVENVPNAAKLLNSLRHLDYSNVSAICDILDNSIDAGADIIRVKLISENKKGINKIEIWDNGSGMDMETLNQAMRLGSETEKNPQYDLGCYGMGLVTASISIGERLELTTYCNDQVSSSVQDLQDIRQANKFLKQIFSENEQNASNFIAELKNNINSEVTSGTRVIIDKIDCWHWIQLSASEKNISSAIGRTFRKFISSGKKIFVNNIEVKAIDPIYDNEPELLTSETFEVNGDEITVKLFALKDYGAQINSDRGYNIPNQGFYILRNNREISGGETLNLFNKHNDYNIFRAEFIFSGSLDNVMNSGFTKQNIKTQLNQSVQDKLSSIVTPHLKQIRSKVKEKQKSNRNKTEDYSEIEKFITKKSHLLKTPKALLEKRNTKEDSEATVKPKSLEQGSPRLDLTKRKRVNLDSMKVRFEVKSMDKVGPLYRADMDKDTTVIFWNEDHPFYESFIIPNENEKDILNPICFLIYSLASAELRSKSDSDSEEIIENIRQDLSQNLRVLMNN